MSIESLSFPSLPLSLLKNNLSCAADRDALEEMLSCHLWPISDTQMPSPFSRRVTFIEDAQTCQK